MSSDSNRMHQYFAKLGIEPEIADIYLALREYGPQSLLQLARNSKVERTKLYRLIDSCREYHLIEIQEEYKRKIYKAAPISNLQIVLTQKEQELSNLEKELLELQEAYKPAPSESPLTHVQFFRGAEGVKQMYWNQTKAQTESLSILFENMQNRTNLAFFERWVARCNERDMHARSIVSDHFLTTQRNWYQANTNEKLKHWEGRYLPDEILPITHSMVTYDDVVAYYNWKDGEVFGLEIHNQEIANTQRNLFEMLWKQGKPIPGHSESLNA